MWTCSLYEADEGLRLIMMTDAVDSLDWLLAKFEDLATGPDREFQMRSDGEHELLDFDTLLMRSATPDTPVTEIGMIVRDASSGSLSWIQCHDDWLDSASLIRALRESGSGHQYFFTDRSEGYEVKVSYRERR